MYNMKCPRVAIQNESHDVPLTKEYVLSDLGGGEEVRNKLGQTCGVPDFFVTLPMIVGKT